MFALSHVSRLYSRLFLMVCLYALSTSSWVYADTASELNARGVEFYEAKDWAQAAETFQRAYTLKSSDPTLQKNLANAGMMYADLLYHQGKIDEATDWLDYVIEVDPENVKPLNQLGAYLLMEGEISSAIFRLEESIEVKPDDVEAHFLLGEAYYKDNDVSSAVTQWEWVYTVQKDYPGLMDRLENALREEQVEYDFKGDHSRNFSVTFSQEAEGKLVKEVLRILEDAYRKIGKDLGGIYPPTPIQVSLYTFDGFFESTQQGEHVGALYDGTKIRCPVLDKKGHTIALDVLEKRLTHEYVHVVVRHMARQNVPWWYNEGLAEVLSGDLTKIEKQLLTTARKNRALFSFEEITSHDVLNTLSPEDLSLAYAQSHATLVLLNRNHGVRKCNTMLTNLREGLIGEEAVRQTYRVNYRMLESQLKSVIDQY